MATQNQELVEKGKEKSKKRITSKSPELVPDDPWNSPWDVKDDNTGTTFGKYF